METTLTPVVLPVSKGEQLKVLQVTGKAGMRMPRHFATAEAVLFIQEGVATLFLEGQEHLLKKGDTFIIPAGKIHSLQLNSGFRAMVIMPENAVIRFDDHPA